MKNYLGLIFLLFAFTATAQNNRSALLPMPCLLYTSDAADEL